MSRLSLIQAPPGALPAGALKVPSGSQKKRIMVLARSGYKKSRSIRPDTPRI